jgi:hypothetical protein
VHGLLGERGVLLDGLEELGVEFFAGINAVVLEAFVPSAELLGVVFVASGLELFHVLVDVDTENSLSVNLRVELVLVSITSALVETGESAGLVGNVDSAVTSSLHGSENSVTSGSAYQTNVQKGLERSAVIMGLIGNVVLISGDLFVSLVERVHLQLGEQSTGQQQTSCIGSRVVGQTSGNLEFLEFAGRSLAENGVTAESGGDDLADNFRVRNTGNESVLRGVVLVLVVDDQISSGIVVSLALSSSSVLGLVALEVSLVFLHLHESHLRTGYLSS